MDIFQIYCEQFYEFQIHFLLVGSELLLERRIYNHLKYEDRFMMILSGKFIREILDLPQTFNVLCVRQGPHDVRKEHSNFYEHLEALINLLRNP